MSTPSREAVEITPEKLATLIERGLLCDGVLRAKQPWRLIVEGRVMVVEIPTGKADDTANHRV